MTAPPDARRFGSGREHSREVGPDADDIESGAHALCLSCGLCCDGTLFRRVRLRAKDAAEALRAGGINLVPRKSRLSFVQPCAALHECCCSVYLDRPSSCRTFRCDVLVGYEGGELSWDEARASIARVVAMRDEVRNELARVAPDTLSGPLADAIPEEALAADPALRRAWAPVLMRMAVLLDHVRTSLLRPRSPAGLVDGSNGATP